MNQNELAFGDSPGRKWSREPPQPKEYKVTAIRDCPMPVNFQLCDTPEKAAYYWNTHVKTHPYYTPDREFLVALFLTTRRKCQGHTLVSVGLLDSVLVHPREVFRAAIIAGASAIVMMHNHPSGDPTPSEADIKATRDLVRAGQLIKIEVLDHIIMGLPSTERPKDFLSLRELGYLC